MYDFEYYNPVRVVFGKNSIAQLDRLIDPGKRIMLLYGGGSIKQNGVYEQVMQTLNGREVHEFGGIEPNPQYQTCLRAVDAIRSSGCDFLLAVGGGSVIDATKFIAAAACFDGGEPWDLVTYRAQPTAAVPFGCVLTLPATGSEMNAGAVISRAEIGRKLPFTNELVFPKFAVLDPCTTFSLPRRQVLNGIVDSFVHVCEQYLTYPVNAPLQNRQAEAVLRTLIDEAPAILSEPPAYEARANFMWCATHALNGIVSCGVPQDWSTHMIGHELTALFGLDHAQTLAIVLPAVLKHQKARKEAKLNHYAETVWGLVARNPSDLAEMAILKTEDFFAELGMPISLKQAGIKLADCEPAIIALEKATLGEHHDIGGAAVREILELAEIG